MTAFEELVWAHTALGGRDLVHLQRLVRDWRPVADLSFSDVLLLAPVAGEDGHRFVVLAHVRSTTGQTIYPQDVVGSVVDEVERPLAAKVWREGVMIEADARVLGGGERAHVQCLPVRRGERMLALLSREESLTPTRRPGEMERRYREAFEAFAGMIAEGTFPYARAEAEIEAEAAPRVSDGVLILDADTRIVFASPNAMSGLHRMGIHAYTSGSLMREVGLDDTAARSALRARLPVAEEIERGDVSVLLRVLPLLSGGRPSGAVVLIRDLTDLRRRDRMLLSKDATIREIHHRVKNNLQTIASLLRLQARRLDAPESRNALAESERRIRSIAIVHETLSRDAGDIVHFGEIVEPLVRLVQEALVSDEVPIAFEIEGDAGELPGEVATPLAVVLNELMQNAVDHAFPPGREGVGHVRVELARGLGDLVVRVTDDGRGLPPGFSLAESKGLGLSIVEALVRGELGGTIEIRGEGGTTVEVHVPV